MAGIETTAVVSFEGQEFKLRKIESAEEIAKLFAKTRLYLTGLENFRLSNGEVIDIPSDLAIACVWVEASLLEPKLTFPELIEMSLKNGALIFILLEKTLELCGLLKKGGETRGD
jgi:hypothetical protein